MPLNECEVFDSFFDESELNFLKTMMQRSFSGEGHLHWRYPSKGAQSDVMATPDSNISNEVSEYLNEKLTPVLDEPFDLQFTFHKNFTPYWLHTDAGYDGERIYKQGIIPLEVQPNDQEVYTVIMDQRCNESSGFTGAESNVEGWLESEANIEEMSVFWDITESRRPALERMSIHTPFQWRIGDTAIWDRAMIHGSSDFSKSGVEYKIGLMWVTTTAS